jgi:hypothetical protein
MLGLIRKGEYVVGLRAIGVGELRFRRGPAIVKGTYIGKMRDCLWCRQGEGRSGSVQISKRRGDLGEEE